MFGKLHQKKYKSVKIMLLLLVGIGKMYQQSLKGFPYIDLDLYQIKRFILCLTQCGKTANTMKTRTKKCRNCSEQFTPYTSLQKYCTKEDCIRVWVSTEKEKAWKKTKAKKKEELMTVQDYIKIAQQVFNKYIRLRDKGQNCISCGNPCKKPNAGHFWNANNHWSVRFDEDNVHLQCEYCNSFLSGNLLPYRANLISKIGFDRYDELEAKARETRKYTIEELKEIISTYKKKIKELESNE